jgi:hypothetical protein
VIEESLEAIIKMIALTAHSGSEWQRLLEIAAEYARVCLDPRRLEVLESVKVSCVVVMQRRSLNDENASYRGVMRARGVTVLVVISEVPNAHAL